MRVHSYEAGVVTATTLPDVSADALVLEVLDVEVGETISTAAGFIEIDRTITIREILTDAGGHIVKHPCREILVTVRYAGAQHVFKLSPSMVLRAVLHDAVTQFGIDLAQAATLTLRQAGNTAAELAETLPVGALTKDCTLVLDLGHITRPQG